MESGVKTVAGLAKTARLSLEKAWGVAITEDSPIAPWMIRHAVFCHNSFQDLGQTNVYRVISGQLDYP